MCGRNIPGPERVCSTCYGDPEYGHDGYLRAEMEADRERAEYEEAMARAQEEAACDWGWIPWRGRQGLWIWEAREDSDCAASDCPQAPCSRDYAEGCGAFVPREAG
jgi:hypothetical protein